MESNAAYVEEALRKADQVLILSQTTDRNYNIVNVIDRVHDNGGKAALLSLDLPYDAGLYEDVDAILCGYNAYGRSHDEEGNGPFNLNVAVIICTAFGQSMPSGSLPVNVPKIEGNSFSDDILYQRGYSLLNWGR